MSFKILCDRCKNEILLEEFFESCNDKINIISTPMENRIVIQCDKCGNQITSK